MELIHYGSNEFSKQKFNPIKNIMFIKPKGGLWTSPIKSSYGWKQWCIKNNFGIERFNKSFKLTLRPEAKILKIDFYEDLLALPKQDVPFNMFFPDFEEIAIDYDVFYLTTRGLWRTMDKPPHKPNLYGWDCETVFILNQDCIILT